MRRALEALLFCLFIKAVTYRGTQVVGNDVCNNIDSRRILFVKSKAKHKKPPPLPEAVL